METTLTQRDKALLLILGIILIIFAAVMIPKFGIYALITTHNENKTAIASQQTENEQLYMDLVSSGISGAYAESGAMAKRYLETKLLNEKHDIARLSNSICRQFSYDTAKKWIYATKYKGFVIGETAYFDAVNVNEPVATPGDSLIMYEISYDVNKYECEIEIQLSSELTYGFNLQYCTNQANLSDLSAMLVMASQATRRGSCFISEFVCDRENYEDAKTTVRLKVFVYTPANSDFSLYASQICECHACGYAYTIDWYNSQLENLTIEGSETVVTCPSCQQVLDGTTIG